jgi:hypothetical protein
MQRDPETLRLRTLAAAALLFAGITLGFTLGRMSVWLIAPGASSRETPPREVSERGALAPPATKPTPAAAATRPPQPSPTPDPTISAPTAPQPTLAPKAAASSPPAPPSAASPAADSAPAVSAAAPQTQEPPKPVVGPNWRAAAGEPSGSVSANDEDSSRGPNVKLINPSAAAPSVAPAEPLKPEADVAESQADRQDIAACERRFSSFRRSDGTYQPFGGGPRLRCPLLR